MARGVKRYRHLAVPAKGHCLDRPVVTPASSYKCRKQPQKSVCRVSLRECGACVSEFTLCVFQDIKGRQGWRGLSATIALGSVPLFSLITNGRQVTAAKLATTCVGNRHSETEKNAEALGANKSLVAIYVAFT